MNTPYIYAGFNWGLTQKFLQYIPLTDQKVINRYGHVQQMQQNIEKLKNRENVTSSVKVK